MAPGAARHKAQLQTTRPSYKVVLEEVSEKKKKLLTLVCCHAERRLTGAYYSSHSSPSIQKRLEDILSFRQATLN